MSDDDHRLKVLWIGRQRPEEMPPDPLDLAEWIDRTGHDEAGAPEVEAALATSPSAREAVLAVRDGGEDPPMAAGERQRCLDAIDRARSSEHSPVVGRLPQLRMTLAAAATLTVAAAGFLTGRVAAPATQQATADFVSTATFDVVSDPTTLEPLFLATGLAASPPEDSELDP